MLTSIFMQTLPPLAEQLRPQNLDELIGQNHLLGSGKPLRTALMAGKIQSMILWGPPGVGKTSLARLMVQNLDAEFIALSAVLAGVKDIRAAVDRATEFLHLKRRTILFIDEIHRFNKSQQDALLPFVENGLLTFIRATTENPSFEVNRALLSRSQVYQLKPLKDADLALVLDKGLEKTGLKLSTDAFEYLIQCSDGDARRLLNLVEHIHGFWNTLEELPKSRLMEAFAASPRMFDKGGDIFYDQISALHKSVRGSNPDASLYWFCRMLDGGCDPLYLGRRIVRMAWEDIGLADPRAMQIANDAISTYERLGSPEGELALAQAVLYLAVAAKSSSGYKAFKEAQSFVANDSSRPVPIHLRNAPTKLMQEFGHGKNYRYSQDEPGGYSPGQTYFPENMPEHRFYKPTERGLEAQIRDKLSSLRKLDAEAKQK